MLDGVNKEIYTLIASQRDFLIIAKDNEGPRFFNKKVTGFSRTTANILV